MVTKSIVEQQLRMIKEYQKDEGDDVDCISTTIDVLNWVLDPKKYMNPINCLT